jgi:Plasmid maintenance system killer protein
VIESFKHKGLKQLFEDDNRKGVTPEYVRKIKQILGLLNAAQKIADLDYATFRLHPLKGDLKGWWSMTVRANWRIIFRFEDGKAFDVDLVDYH